MPRDLATYPSKDFINQPGESCRIKPTLLIVVGLDQRTLLAASLGIRDDLSIDVFRAFPVPPCCVTGVAQKTEMPPIKGHACVIDDCEVWISDAACADR
jgi:hypothetical protein